jgi:hypothetical protein
MRMKKEIYKINHFHSISKAMPTRLKRETVTAEYGNEKREIYKITHFHLISKVVSKRLKRETVNI